MQVNKYNFLRWQKPDAAPIIDWELDQSGSPYVDANIRVYKNGSLIVDQFVNNTGSFTAADGDIIKVEATVLDPLPTNAMIYLEVKVNGETMHHEQKYNPSVPSIAAFITFKVYDNSVYSVKVSSEEKVGSTSSKYIPYKYPSNLAKGYVRDENRCAFMPIVQYYEPLQFYINTDDGLNISTTNSLRLVNHVTGATTNLTESKLGVHQFQTTPSILNTHYGTVIVPNNVTPGVYYLQIYNGSTVYFESSLIRVVSNNDERLNGSCLFSFKHDRYFYGINYHLLEGFEQQFRLMANQIEMQPESDEQVYNEVTTGKQRTYNATHKKVVKIEMYYLDEEAHEAAMTMFNHETMFINGKQYVSKNEYKIIPNITGKLSKGEIELYDQSFSSINKC